MLFLCLCFHVEAWAQSVLPDDTLTIDSSALTTFEVPTQNVVSRRKRKRLIRGYVGAQFDELNNIDTTYITPQLYDYAVMVQNTTTFESFSISSAAKNNDQLLRFAPKPTLRLGGYFGWRWLFLGYTFDVGSLLGQEAPRKRKTEIDLSFYTSRLGIDLYYRKTGSDFRCTNLNDLFDAEHPRPDNLSADFDALNLNTRGINVYYIFNHHHFSWPAAFSQSTVQRRSCGTFKLGFSFTHHKITLDPSRLDPRLDDIIDHSMLFDVIKYNDFSFSFGYAYNWVPRRNLLFTASFSPAVAYDVAYMNMQDAVGRQKFNDDLRQFFHFSDNKISLDFILRLGAVYNNTKYFAGASFILHSFNYHNEQVRLNNAFGSLNFYVGLNFKRRTYH